MECTGKLVGVARDWNTGKMTVTFQIDGEPTEEINKLLECEKLSIEAKKHRQKRSIDANALLWVCLGQIANALRADKWDIYLQMLRRYGKFTYICVKPAVVDSVKSQWRESEVIGEIDINGQKAVQMLCYFGSSTYNTQEFTVLLDGVISEMREMNLETPTSEDMRRSLEAWEKKLNQQ